MSGGRPVDANFGSTNQTIRSGPMIEPRRMAHRYLLVVVFIW
jgi:hypothetical protein